MLSTSLNVPNDDFRVMTLPLIQSPTSQVLHESKTPSVRASARHSSQATATSKHDINRPLHRLFGTQNQNRNKGVSVASLTWSRILLRVSLLCTRSFSMPSSLTRTASILETKPPMVCSMRSTRRDKMTNSSWGTEPSPDDVPARLPIKRQVYRFLR